MPSIEPPDPGQPLQMARDYGYDSAARGFTDGSTVRWLRPDAGRWTACATPERTFSQETYDRLRAGEQVGSTPRFESPAHSGDFYVLADTGFEARADPA